MRMKVTYRTERGLETDLLSKTELKSGRFINYQPTDPFEFTLPAGQDTIVFDVDGKELILRINLK